VKQHAAGVHENRQEAIVRELPDFPARRTHVTAAQHKCGTAVQDRTEKVRIIGNVVFQIRILYEENVPGRRREPLPQRMPLAARPVLIDRVNTRRPCLAVACDELGHDLTGTVGGVAFDDDEFPCHLRKRLRPHAFEQRGDGVRLVVHGDDDRNFHGLTRAFPSAGRHQPSAAAALG